MSTKHSVYLVALLYIVYMVYNIIIYIMQFHRFSPLLKQCHCSWSLFMHNTSIDTMKRIYITFPRNIKYIGIHEQMNGFMCTLKIWACDWSYCSTVLTKWFRNSITNSPTNTNIIFVYLYVLPLVIQTQ